MIKMPTRKKFSPTAFLGTLRRDCSGVAMVEFAVSLPFFVGLTVMGIESANYASVTMQLNQLTLHTADGAARMGEGSQLAARQIKEIHINDVFSGTAREGENLLLDGKHAYTDPNDGTVSLRGNAKIIISSVEPVASFDSDDPKYRIRWQRCMGQSDFYSSSYGDPQNTTSVDAVGPAGRQVTAPENGAVMFVETQYYFKPIIFDGISLLTERTIKQTAAMVVRDQRNYTQIFNPENVTPSTCT